MNQIAVTPTLDSAIRCLEEARRALVAQYLDLPPHDPGYEMAVASTSVPPQYGALSQAMHATYGHLLNLRDILTEED